MKNAREWQVWQRKKRKRIRRKTIEILCCILVLLGMIGWREFRQQNEQGKTEEARKSEIVIKENVWVCGRTGQEICYFFHNQKYTALIGKEISGEAVLSIEEGVADLVLQDGVLTSIAYAKAKIAGKLLEIRENQFEIAGYGEWPVAKEFQGYRLYGSLQSYEARELPIGAEYIDYVVKDGEICAALVTQKEALPKIRVLLHKEGTDAGQGIYREQVSLTCAGNFCVEAGDFCEEVPAGESIEITDKSDCFEKENRVWVYPKAGSDKLCILEQKRNQGIPYYRGALELVKEEQGIYVINELLLEEYLYAVVPSEMPASYPMEALKAQSVCARTYAMKNIAAAGLPEYGAHVDDSTAYQVYQNIGENERTTEAVRETTGWVLWDGERVADIYYYSTSCGYGTDTGIWHSDGGGGETYFRGKHIARGEEAKEKGRATGEDVKATQEEKVGEIEKEREEEIEKESGIEKDVMLEETGWDTGDIPRENAFEEYLKSCHSDDWESEEPWYRWNYTVDSVMVDTLQERLEQRKQLAPDQILWWDGSAFDETYVGSLGALRDIRIEKRGSGGVADTLLMQGSQGAVRVLKEYNIRYVLCDGRVKVIRQDGSEATMATLLPSGFFVLQTGKEGEDVVQYHIIGGGLGHGVGMSQNGALHMAKEEKRAEEILSFFYPGCILKTMSIEGEQDAS